MRSRIHVAGPSRRRGFTLIEIAVVLVILALIASLGFGVLRSLMSTGQSRQTATALQNTDVALTSFVILAKRLPCPANGSLAATDPQFGTAPASCTAASEANGVVPWVTLGLPMSDVSDGYGNLITYRVDPLLTADGAMDFTECDPAASDMTPQSATTRVSGCKLCNTTDPVLNAPAFIPSHCTKPSTAYQNKGLKVASSSTGTPVLADPTSATTPSGAAYVLISHGPNMARAYTSQGGFNPGGGNVGDGEMNNGSDLGVKPFYVSSPIDGSESTSHFDDSLVFPTVSIVATRAGLGPRAHQPN